MVFEDLLKKLRNKPEKTKIIIVWSIIIPLGLIFFIWWIIIARNSIERTKDVSFPEIGSFIEEESKEEIEKIKSFFQQEDFKKIIDILGDKETLEKIIDNLENEEDLKEVIERLESGESLEEIIESLKEKEKNKKENN